jgi:hypothetical protein
MAKSRKRPLFARCDEPPNLPRVTPIKKIGDTDSIKVIVLATKLFGVWTHWNGDNTVPCLAHSHPDECPYHQMPKRWKGFLHCWNDYLNTTFFVEVTDLAAQKLTAELPEGRPLRGAKFVLGRERQTRKAPISVSYQGHYEGPKQLPREETPEVTLAALWRAYY